LGLQDIDIPDACSSAPVFFDNKQSSIESLLLPEQLSELFCLQEEDPLQMFTPVLSSATTHFPVAKEESITFPHAPVPKKKLPPIDELSDQELQETIDQHFVDLIPHKNDQQSDLYLRWLQAPPDRVHATSPSKLSNTNKPGGTFSFSLQLVTCFENSFVPYPAPEDIDLVARIYGRTKSKNKNDEEPINSAAYVLLEKNPIGKSLLAAESGNSVTATLCKGECVVTFSGVYLTCGSNPARSPSAPLAARDWDWDYFMKVEVTDQHKHAGAPIRSLFSRHITTDSNRSQTREKRRRPNEMVFPPCKRNAPNCPIAPNFGIFQPHPVQSAHTFNPLNDNSVFSSFIRGTKLSI